MKLISLGDWTSAEHADFLLIISSIMLVDQSSEKKEHTRKDFWTKKVNAAATLHLFDGGRRPPGFYDVSDQYCARFIGDFPWLRAVMETPAEILLSFCCNGRRSTMLSTTLNNLMKHSRGLFRVL